MASCLGVGSNNFITSIDRIGALSVGAQMAQVGFTLFSRAACALASQLIGPALIIGGICLGGYLVYRLAKRPYEFLSRLFNDISTEAQETAAAVAHQGTQALVAMDEVVERDSENTFMVRTLPDVSELADDDEGDFSQVGQAATGELGDAVADTLSRVPGAIGGAFVSGIVTAGLAATDVCDRVFTVSNRFVRGAPGGMEEVSDAVLRQRSFFSIDTRESGFSSFTDALIDY